MSINLDVGRLGAVQTTLGASPKIDELPQEVLTRIFSNLSSKDLQAAACVSRSMHYSVKAAANLNELKAIENFILRLLRKLNAETFPVQRKQLIEISRNIVPLDFANLLILRKIILDVKAQLINVIKTLDPETENDLGDGIALPHFLEDIFKLASFERQIDAANLILNEDAREKALNEISQALIRADNVGKAIEVTKLVSREIIRWKALHDISQALMQADNVDRAIEVAKLIPRETIRGKTLYDISQALIQADNVDRAIEVAELISKEIIRENALRYICEVLAGFGNFDRAIQVANLISDIRLRECVLQDIHNPH